MAARKSMIFLNSVLPPRITHEDLVRQKLKPGKYVFTPAGMINVVGFVFILAAIIFFLVFSKCEDEDDWRSYLFAVMNIITLLVTTVLYLIFSTGRTVTNPWFWVKTNIICNIVFPILTIIASTVSTSACKNSNQLHKLPMPLGITGGIVLIVSSAALFLLYRYEEEPEQERRPQIDVDSRKKSMHV